LAAAVQASKVLALANNPRRITGHSRVCINISGDYGIHAGYSTVLQRYTTDYTHI
jgi:hypothetical protein